MRTGGASDKNLKSYFITTREILKSLKNNKLKKVFRVILRGF